MARNQFGTVRKLPSGRFQARYTGPDEVRRTAGSFTAKKEALASLAAIHADIATLGDAWIAPGIDPEHDEQTKVAAFAKSIGMTKSVPTFGKFSTEVMRMRAEELAPRTRENYESLLRRYLLPAFGHLPLTQITVYRVDQWWADMATKTGQVNRRNSYFLLSSIMRFALRYKHVQSSPCIQEGAGKNVAQPRPHLSVEDFRRILGAMPDGLHTPLWVMLGSHARLGELIGLNIGDVDLDRGTVSITKQSQVARGGTVTRQTKTGNQREVKMLEQALDALTWHLAGSTEPGDAPLFRGPKGGRLTRGYLSSQWVKAREVVGLPDAHIHDVRHTGLTLIAPGATTKEVMARGGHTSVQAALRYQHATKQRDAAVADAASARLREMLG